MNNRRKLVIALGAGALAAPLAGFAQQQPAKVRRIGTLGLGSDYSNERRVEALLAGLRELGHVEGKHFVIEGRSINDKPEQLSNLAAGLVRLKVDVIVTSGVAATRAAQKATTTIPIVFGNLGDPVAQGFVKSLARPGGNITGHTTVAGDLNLKLLEMLRSLLPKLSRVAILMNPANPEHIVNLKNVQAAAQKIGMTIVALEVRDTKEIESALAVMVKEKAQALIVRSSPPFMQERHRIAELAAKNRLPMVSTYREYAEAGGLFSYGPNLTDNYRRVAVYVDKIFKGAKPADLPVEEPTKFELVINRKTAKALGLTIPQSLLIMMDQAID